MVLGDLNNNLIGRTILIPYEEAILEINSLIEKKYLVNIDGIAKLKEIPANVAKSFIEKQIYVKTEEESIYNFTARKKEHDTIIEIILNKTPKPKEEQDPKNYSLMNSGKELIITYFKSQ